MHNYLKVGPKGDRMKYSCFIEYAVEVYIIFDSIHARILKLADGD